MGKLMVVASHFLLLCAALLVPPTITAAQPTLQSPPLQENRYAPIRFGIPETIGGYRVLAVLTEDNHACMSPGEKHLVLQSPQSTIEDGPRDFPKDLIKQELQALNLTEPARWESSIVGPGVTREQLVREFEQSYHFYKEHDCPTLKLPLTTSYALAASTVKCPLIAGSELTGGEARCESPGPGFAIIQHLGPE